MLTPEMFRTSFSPYIWGMKMVFIDLNMCALLHEQASPTNSRSLQPVQDPLTPGGPCSTHTAIAWCMMWRSLMTHIRSRSQLRETTLGGAGQARLGPERQVLPVLGRMAPSS